MKIAARHVLFIFLFLIFTHPFAAYAESWSLAAPEYNEEIWLINSANKDAVVYVSSYHAEENSDQDLALKVPASRSIKLGIYDLPKGPWLKFFVSEYNQIEIYTKKDSQLIKVPAGRSRKLNLLDLTSQAVSVTNLSALNQSGAMQILRENSPTETIRFYLKKSETLSFQIKNCEPCDIHIQGELAISARSIDHKRVSFFEPEAEEIYKKSSIQSVRFLMTNPNASQSFVVELTDPTLIWQAREQIKHPTDLRARILIAQISTGHGEVNQNLTDSMRGSWSWHVTNAIKFAEMASSSCEASPDYVEDFLDPWINSQRPICFWNYRVIQELK